MSKVVTVSVFLFLVVISLSFSAPVYAQSDLPFLHCLLRITSNLLVEEDDEFELTYQYEIEDTIRHNTNTHPTRVVVPSGKHRCEIRLKVSAEGNPAWLTFKARNNNNINYPIYFEADLHNTNPENSTAKLTASSILMPCSPGDEIYLLVRGIGKESANVAGVVDFIFWP